MSIENFLLVIALLIFSGYNSFLHMKTRGDRLLDAWIKLFFFIMTFVSSMAAGWLLANILFKGLTK